MPSRNLFCLTLILALASFFVVFACQSKEESDDDDDQAADDTADDSEPVDDDSSDDDDGLDDDSGDDSFDDDSDDDMELPGDYNVTNFEDSGCLSNGKDAADDSLDDDTGEPGGPYTPRLVLNWDGTSRLSVDYGPNCLNCAQSLRFSYDLEYGEITLYETMVGDDMALCDCLFEYSFDLTGIQPGYYLFKYGALEMNVSFDAGTPAEYSHDWEEQSGCL
jgi:hypothetical protein